jgi:hypothetical protein
MEDGLGIGHCSIMYWLANTFQKDHFNTVATSPFAIYFKTQKMKII